MYRNIDADKARHSFKRLKGRQVRILQRHLLEAVDRVMTARAFFDHSGDKTLLLRSLSEVYALNALKRELQAEGPPFVVPPFTLTVIEESYND